MLERFHVPADIAVRVDADDVRETVEDIFRALGMPDEDAAQSADVLLYADLRGIDTHGVSNMLRVYVSGFREGRINPTPRWSIVRDGGAACTIDSDGAHGGMIGPAAMGVAIERAREHGVGAVSVANGGHFGAAAYHAAMALEHDMVGVAMTAGGVAMTPTYGAERLVGLNPLAIAAPAREEPPYIFDASMSSVAGNKIRLAQRLSQGVLPGWIAEADGTPIMEEREIPDEFLMLPLGGNREIGSHKGYGLAVMIEILTSVLAGQGAGPMRRSGQAHHFVAYRIDAFADVETFKDDMDVYLRVLRECEPAPGEERVVYAGLVEHETEAERRERGIPYHPEVIDWFREVGEELGIRPRFG